MKPTRSPASFTEEPAEALELTVTYEKNGQTFTAKFTVSVAETPDVLKALRPYAEISFGHNDSYKGEAGKEFVYDNDEGAVQEPGHGHLSGFPSS